MRMLQTSTYLTMYFKEKYLEVSGFLEDLHLARPQSLAPLPPLGVPPPPALTSVLSLWLICVKLHDELDHVSARQSPGSRVVTNGDSSWAM